MKAFNIKLRQAILAMALMLAAFMLPVASAHAQSHGTEELSYDPFVMPSQPMSPYVGETRAYVYDLQTAAQVQYWSDVVDGLAGKISAYNEDINNIDTAEKMWEFIADHDIALNYREKQVLCLYLQYDDGTDPPVTSDDLPTAEQISPALPSWPRCGNVLQTMFGPRIIEYLYEHSAGGDDDPRDPQLTVIAHMLETIGLNPDQIEGTVRGQGVLESRGQSFDFGEADVLENEECYNAANNVKEYVVDGCGVLCTVTSIVMALLEAAAESIVNATADNANFQAAVMAAMLLYTVIYGAMVLLGVVRVAIGDAIVRLVKLGIVATLISSTTVALFFDMVRCFFIEGTTYLVNAVSLLGLEAAASLTGEAPPIVADLTSGVGGLNICSHSYALNPDDGVGPLVVLEALITQLFSPQMFLVLVTLVLSKVYGIVLAVFLIGALWALTMSILTAVTIYLSALIAQYLLLSLLPFFIAFMLFDRTKYLFEGWINQLVSYSLAPIFLFAYISLFILVIEAALASILDVTICWAKWFQVVWIFDIYKWHFWDLSFNGPAIDLPFGFFEILILYLLCYLMKEFEKSVEQIAIDIGNSYVYAGNAANALQSWMGNKTKALRQKGLSQVSRFAGRGGNFARGGVGGHQTNSQSGQTGVGGAAGGNQQANRSPVGRRPPPGGRG